MMNSVEYSAESANWGKYRGSEELISNPVRVGVDIVRKSPRSLYLPRMPTTDTGCELDTVSTPLYPGSRFHPRISLRKKDSCPLAGIANVTSGCDVAPDGFRTTVTALSVGLAIAIPVSGPLLIKPPEVSARA